MNIDDLTKYELLESKGWTLKAHVKTKVMEDLNIEGEKEVRCDYLNMDQISKEITEQNLHRGGNMGNTRTQIYRLMEKIG